MQEHIRQGLMKEIPITAFPGIRIGQVENAEAGTGCTVFLCPEGMRAGLDVRGGGPASRDSQLLNPLMAAERVHGILLGGGSAYGLGASDGVMRYLEEKRIGLAVGDMIVPLVCQSDIFDLTVGDGNVRPDPAMGYEAARQAMEAPNFRDGNFGAGCGATVGKTAGMEHCMKSGIGSFAIRLGDLMIGAVAVVNALGEIRDPDNGVQIAGVRNGENSGFLSTLDLMAESAEGNGEPGRPAENTTISVLMTNGRFEKAALCKLAGIAHDGYARAIRPVHLSMDGDSIYAVSLGIVPADMDLVGALGAEVMSRAIVRGVTSAEQAYGYPAARDLGFSKIV